mgnify:FL=1
MDDERDFMKCFECGRVAYECRCGCEVFQLDKTKAILIGGLDNATIISVSSYDRVFIHREVRGYRGPIISHEYREVAKDEDGFRCFELYDTHVY